MKLASPPAQNITRAAFTIAVGKPIYREMAFALARSFKRWNRGSDIVFCLATDDQVTPGDLRDITLIPIQDGEYGRGFGPKLHLDRLAPARRSLFIDADCLCTGSLEPVFQAFAGNDVGVIGREISDGEWFGDVAAICARFGIGAMPRFNGGVYYLEAGDKCRRIFDTAREILPSYGSAGFRLLRGTPNDEVIMSVAMAAHGQKPIADTGKLMNSVMAAPGGIVLDVLDGVAILRNPREHPGHNPWYVQEELRPKIVHFLGAGTDVYPYSREIAKLKLVAGLGWPAWAAKLWAVLFSTIPHRLQVSIKYLLRPAYRALVGYRPARSVR